jgi:hypothetical protein
MVILHKSHRTKRVRDSARFYLVNNLDLLVADPLKTCAPPLRDAPPDWYAVR